MNQAQMDEMFLQSPSKQGEKRPSMFQKARDQSEIKEKQKELEEKFIHLEDDDVHPLQIKLEELEKEIGNIKE
jgi:hypothetical protein